MPLPATSSSAYPDLDALLAGAKDALARANALDATVPHDDVPAPLAAPAAPALPDDSLWGRIKRVANWSPLPTDIGERFANDVDPNTARDAKALRGEYGPLDSLKSFLAGAGGGFFDELRATATPAGLGAMVTPEGKVGRLVSGAASGVFAGEGAEDLASGDPARRARGLANLLLGSTGAIHAAGLGGEFPHGQVEPTPGNPDAIPVSTTKPGTAERFSPNVSGEIQPGDPAALADRIPPPSVADATPRQMADATGVDLPFDTTEPLAGTPPAVETPSGQAEPDLSPAAPGKPRISADEFANILKGRQKLTAQNPDLELPPGARDELDRMGLEYGRTQRTLKQLLGMPDADPAEIARMNQGARELGSRLRKAVKDYTAPPEPPEPPTGGGGAPSSLMDMLKASIADQDARGIAPPGREGHFTLPEANVPDAVYDKIRAAKGIAPSPLATEAATVAGPQAEPASASFNPDEAVTDAAGRVIAPPQGAPVARAEGPWDLNGTGEVPTAPPASVSQDTVANPAANPEAGFATTAALARLLRVPIGAAAGAVFDPENRTRGALIGGGLGAASLVPGLSDRAERLRYFSMLAGPAPLKKIISDTGVVLNAAGERALTHGPSEGLNVLKEFFNPETAADFANRVKTGGDPSALMDRPASTSYQGVLGLPPRLMGSATEASAGALSRAGVEDAEKRLFFGEPETKAGKAALQFQRSSKLARLILPFAKTAINQTEQGVLPFVRAADIASLDPTARRALLAQLATRVGAMGAGAALGTTDFADEHPTLTALSMLLAGPGAIPALVGEGFSHALHNDKNAPQALSAAAGELRHGLPLPSEWATSPSELIASLAPSGLKLLNPDDEAHDTTGSVFGPLLARLPFLSDTLPLKGSGKPKKSLLHESE